MALAKTLTGAPVLSCFIFLAGIAADAGASESESIYGSVLKFTAGVLSASLIHEGSHALVAGVTGTRLTWEVGTYNQPIGFTDHAGSKEKGVAVYSAGLLSQTAGAEIILQVDGIDKNDSFVRGMMFWDVVNPILYSLDYWFFRNSNKSNGRSYQGDLEGIEHYSSRGTANGFALGLTTIGVFQGYRFLKTQDWAPDWLKGEDKKLGFAPLASGGLVMTYHFEF